MSSVHDKLKTKLAGERSGFGWKPKDGDNRILILPPAAAFVDDLEGIEYLAFKYQAHYFEIEGKSPMEVSRCLQDVEQRCPACAANRSYSKSTDPGLAELGKRVRAASQYVFNILDLNDTAKGAQRWAANYTCWKEIMAIAANPAWGIVYDPRNAVPFVISLTPKGKSKTGWNTYTVQPEPQKLNAYDLLVANPAGLSVLDGLEDIQTEVKSAEAIQALLDEMGFPPPRTGATSAPAAVPAAVAAPVPIRAAAPAAAAPIRAGNTVSVPAPAAGDVPVARPVAVTASAPVPVTAAVPVAAPARGSVRPADERPEEE